MATGLQVRNLLNLSPPYYSGGYAGEDVGGSGGYNDWTDVALSGTSNSYYWYSDSDVSQNENSIKVFVYVTDSWTASIATDNSITVNYSTTITKIEKAQIRGNPGTTPRDIRISSCPSCPVVYSFNNTPPSLYVVARNLPSLSGSFTLPPESERSIQNSIYYKSFLPGHEFDPLPSQYVDAMGMGLAFKNTLPKDYRPGKILDGNTWRSHNRSGGAADIYVNNSRNTMRTINGPSAVGNPPYMRHDDGYHNMRLVGQQ